MAAEDEEPKLDATWWVEAADKHSIMNAFEHVRSQLPINARDYYHLLTGYARTIEQRIKDIWSEGALKEETKWERDPDGVWRQVMHMTMDWEANTERYRWRVLVEETYVKDRGEWWLTDLEVKQIKLRWDRWEWER